MKLAVLGGSFNPIHNGHLALADQVCCELGYDKVLFIPTGSSPHKILDYSADSQDRLNMVKLACSEDSRFEECSLEIDRGGVSYTFDTITALEEKYSQELEEKIGLILGRDLFSGFHLWHRADELSRKCTLILAERPYEKSSSSNALGEYRNIDHSRDISFDISSEPLFKNACCLNNALLQISSSEIRKRAKEGGSFKYLVPKPVFEYIKSRNLYGC